MGRWAPWRTSLLVALVVAASAAADERPFTVHELASPGRTAAAELADLDGDGRTDLFSVAFAGLPPRDQRSLRVYLQKEGGVLPATPDWSGPIPDGTAAFDLADLPDGPGREIVLLLPDRLAVLSFAGAAPSRRDVAVPGGHTLASARDERGLDRLRLVRDGLGPRPRLLVPGLGEALLLELDGTPVARLAVGGISNYFIPRRPGPLIGENEVETFHDFPRLDVADVDGDGRGDLVASNRFELRVFLQREDGGFGGGPDRRIELGRIREEDLVRGSGLVRSTVAEIDGDGRADLLVTYVAGGLLEGRSRTTLHLNRDGSWDPSAPDQEWLDEGGWNAFDLVDLDADGALEMVQARVPLSILELVELLLTRSADMEVTILRRGAKRPFARTPWFRTKLGVGFDFDRLEPSGFLPTLEPDLNGDGIRDFLDSGDGEAVEVYLGGPDGYRTRSASQAMDTRGSLRAGDLDRDGLSDFVLYDRTRPDTPIRIGVNRGVLPGSRRRPELRPADPDRASPLAPGAQPR